MSNKDAKRLALGVLSVVILICMAFGAFECLSNVVYQPDSVAKACMESGNGINVFSMNDYISFEPEEPKAAFLFYPTAFVDPISYAPLMRELAENDVLAIVAKIPFSISPMNSDAIENIRSEFPTVTEWYIGGHALGAETAAKYVAEKPDSVKGLVLLAGYSKNDISSSGIKCLSVYGTNDGVMSMEKYKECYANLPDGTVECVIKGGNHTLFGNYGGSLGDERATVSSEKQIGYTSDRILKLILGEEYEFRYTEAEILGLTPIETTTEEPIETTTAEPETKKTATEKSDKKTEEKQTVKKTAEKTTKSSAKKTESKTTVKAKSDNSTKKSSNKK